MSGFRQTMERRDTLIVRQLPSGDVERFDAADPFIQSEDSAVVALAATLKPLFDRRDYAAAMAIVRERVRPVTAVDAPIDARGALDAGRARPDGLARLVTALLRHDGIAARFVVGVMPVGDTMYTHAWVELDRGRGERATLDPLTGRQASTRLIRLAFAGSSYPEDLVLQVADVRFTPVETPVHESEGQ